MSIYNYRNDDVISAVFQAIFILLLIDDIPLVELVNCSRLMGTCDGTLRSVVQKLVDHKINEWEEMQNAG